MTLFHVLIRKRTLRFFICITVRLRRFFFFSIKPKLYLNIVKDFWRSLAVNYVPHDNFFSAAGPKIVARAWKPSDEGQGGVGGLTVRLMGGGGGQ
jgi:hypothetical protein